MWLGSGGAGAGLRECASRLRLACRALVFRLLPRARVDESPERESRANLLPVLRGIRGTGRILLHVFE